MKRPDDPIDWLMGLQSLGMTLGLERTAALLRAAGDPQESFEAVLVAGTNGKGSCAAALHACLLAAGRRSALFTSPHLTRFTERFVVAEGELERETVAAAVARLRPAAEELGASFFEVVTATACLLFSEAGAEIAVMEVGLGGRFDSTNALDPVLSIVTGVALDHTALLGDTLEAIAGEKAEVMRPGRPALTAAEGGALEVIRSRSRELGSRLWAVGEEIEVAGEELGWHGVGLEVDCPAGRLRATSPLVGRHQIRNLALAAAAAMALGVERSAVVRGLATVRWPGRLERFEIGGRWVVLDGAHNESAANRLAEALRRLEATPYTLVIGVSAEKDMPAIAAALGPAAARVLATRASFTPRARPPAEVAAAFGRVEASASGGEDPAAATGDISAASTGEISVASTGQVSAASTGEISAASVAEVEAFDGPGEALAAALESTPPGGTVVVAGSLFLVGELRPQLTGEQLEVAERWQ